MTYEEARQYLNNELTVLRQQNESAVEHRCRHEANVIRIAEALQKQIPKKPEAYYDGFYGVYPVWEYKCPCCGRDIYDMDHHCECGQAIDWDWGDEE